MLSLRLITIAPATVLQEMLNKSFLQLARELDITEPKSPEDIYKTHLESKGRESAMSPPAPFGPLSKCTICIAHLTTASIRNAQDHPR